MNVLLYESVCPFTAWLVQHHCPFVFVVFWVEDNKHLWAGLIKSPCFSQLFNEYFCVDWQFFKKIKKIIPPLIISVDSGICWLTNYFQLLNLTVVYLLQIMRNLASYILKASSALMLVLCLAGNILWCHASLKEISTTT